MANYSGKLSASNQMSSDVSREEIIGQINDRLKTCSDENLNTVFSQLEAIPDESGVEEEGSIPNEDCQGAKMQAFSR